MFRAIKQGFVVCVFPMISLVAHAQTDPPVKVVVIPIGGEEAAKEKVIFITKNRYQGDLGGLSGADTKCQADADASDSKVKGKIFKAWLNSPSDPLEAGGRSFNVYDLPYMTTTGEQLADSYTSLISMNPWPFLRFAANGTDITSTATYDEVWTGRGFQGTGSADTCSNWTDGTTGFGAVFGDNRTTEVYRAGRGTCAEFIETPRVVCMEQ